jgi:hypothetical protein
MPRWVKVVLVAALAALLVIVVVLLTGGGGEHGPGRHSGHSAPAGTSDHAGR